MSNVSTLDPKAIVRDALLSRDIDDKFTNEEVNTMLTTAGMAFLKDYTGGFDYLVDLKAKSRKFGLSTGQIRGILNCIRAEILREGQRELADEATPVANGRYAINVDGKLRFFHVNTPSEGRWDGYTFVKEFIGGGNEFPIKGRESRNRILGLISQDSDSLARYGRELGVCGVCGRPLTDTPSREAGIGPVCIQKLGM